MDDQALAAFLQGPVIFARMTSDLKMRIVSVQIGNVFCCRTDRQSVFTKGIFSNKLILFGIVTEVALIFLLVYTPFSRKVFSLAPLGFKEWLLLLCFGPLILLMEEGRKWLIRHLHRS